MIRYRILLMTPVIMAFLNSSQVLGDTTSPLQKKMDQLLQLGCGQDKLIKVATNDGVSIGCQKAGADLNRYTGPYIIISKKAGTIERGQKINGKINGKVTIYNAQLQVAIEMTMKDDKLNGEYIERNAYNPDYLYKKSVWENGVKKSEIFYGENRQPTTKVAAEVFIAKLKSEMISKEARIHLSGMAVAELAFYAEHATYTTDLVSLDIYESKHKETSTRYLCGFKLPFINNIQGIKNYDPKRSTFLDLGIQLQPGAKLKREQLTNSFASKDAFLISCVGQINENTKTLDEWTTNQKNETLHVQTGY